MIKENIVPEIKKIEALIDSQINEIIYNVLELNTDEKENHEKLVHEKEELKKATIIKAAFGFWGLIGDVVGMLGPEGAAAKTVIDLEIAVLKPIALSVASSINQSTVYLLLKN